MKPHVTDDQIKDAEKMAQQNRHRKTKGSQEVCIRPHPAVVELLCFHNNGPAFLPLDASVDTTQDVVRSVCLVVQYLA